MRVLAALLLMSTALGGCADVAPTPQVSSDLDVYVFYYPVEGEMTSRDSGHPLGWAVRIVNNGNQSVTYEAAVRGLVEGEGGMVSAAGWDASPIGSDAGVASQADMLAAGESRLWLFRGAWFGGHGFTMEVLVDDEVAFSQELATHDGGGTAVRPGDHVLTRTVGMWVNGTSFYTNIPELLADPAYPAGGNIDRVEAMASAADLPVYVYDQDRSEQPARSMDTCHFTTIPGYNALLKSQVAGVTDVRFLSPEEGYTRAGAEDHLLYGDALVFLNVVVAVEPRDQRLDDIPDPQGDCFDAERYSPLPFPL